MKGDVKRFALIIALAALAALAVGISPSPAKGPEARGDTSNNQADDGSLPAFIESSVASGMHWRFEGTRGPVHVWLPPGYRHETAGIVLYVHGYYTTVDAAWTEHRLAEQFRASGRNALFIVPEAPARRGQNVHWRDLGALIREARSRVDLERPWGPVIAVGHSGAYRTLLSWLSYPPLDHVILLDALYSHEYPFRHWLEQVEGTPNRLTMIAIDTLRWSEPFARQIRTGRTFDWLPSDPSRLEESHPRPRPRAAPQADDLDSAPASRFVYIRSQYDHMELVTDGTAIPVLLQTTALGPLEAP